MNIHELIKQLLQDRNVSDYNDQLGVFYVLCFTDIRKNKYMLQPNL